MVVWHVVLMQYVHRYVWFSLKNSPERTGQASKTSGNYILIIFLVGNDLYTWNPNDTCFGSKSLVPRCWPSKIEFIWVPGNAHVTYTLTLFPTFEKIYSCKVDFCVTLSGLFQGLECGESRQHKHPSPWMVTRPKRAKYEVTTLVCWRQALSIQGSKFSTCFFCWGMSSWILMIGVPSTGKSWKTSSRCDGFTSLILKSF